MKLFIGMIWRWCKNVNFSDIERFITNFQADKSFGSGASEEAIHSVEAKLGVKIAGSYRLFLSRYGWADIGSNEIYGLGDDVPLHLELVSNTFWERNEAFRRLPAHMVPVYNDGLGNLYVLNTDQVINDENPLCFWDHESLPDQPAEYIAASFAAWFCNELMANEE